MTTPVTPTFHAIDLDLIKGLQGRIAVAMDEEGRMDNAARRVNRLSKGALQRFAESDDFEGMQAGSAFELSYPNGMDAICVIVIKLPKRPSVSLARSSGAAIAKQADGAPLHLFLGNNPKAVDVVFGCSVRGYAYTDQKTDATDPTPASIAAYTNAPEQSQEDYTTLQAIAEGIFFTRDLVNAPANVLTTTEFADQLVALKAHGLEVEVFEEAEMEKLGMHAMLGVGLGSETPTKMVVMKWNGGGSEAPFALVGKGVVFDTGGISIKPAGGMEDMTMDMGGAGVVAGVMKTIAMRKAKANVVGLVGLVENMPDGKAQRPGDVVKSMKGDTIEVINTDAEGRLVLADVLWYAQQTFNPSGIIDLATLTGAIIIGLGHENAGVFSNSDQLSKDFLKAAGLEDEGAWRMPMGKGYDAQIKSRVADMMNVGGRAAGSITAAQFLQRFVKEDTPWIHLDIAGVASLKTDSTLAPKGATGWGVMALNRLIQDTYETK